MLQYDTWGIEIARSCCGEVNAGGFVVAVLEPRNGIVSMHVTWVNKLEELVRPLLL